MNTMKRWEGKSPAPWRETARGEERELMEIVGVLELRGGSNSQRPALGLWNTPGERPIPE
jgi:hypothetical protein